MAQNHRSDSGKTPPFLVIVTYPRSDEREIRLNKKQTVLAGEIAGIVLVPHCHEHDPARAEAGSWRKILGLCRQRSLRHAAEKFGFRFARAMISDQRPYQPIISPSSPPHANQVLHARTRQDVFCESRVPE